MSSILTITAAAADRSLLTQSELAAAVGVPADGIHAAALLDLGRRVSSVIARQCKVRVAGITPPTLRLETIEETFEYVGDRIMLSRRPVVSITSVLDSSANVVLTTDDYRLDAAAGIISPRRHSGTWLGWWGCCDTIVTYVAGWDVVPDDLKLAAAKTALIFWSENGPVPRDPSLKRIRTEGVDELEWWISPASDPMLSAEVVEMLMPYTQYPLG